MFLDAWIAAAGVVMVLVTLTWLLSLLLRDSSIVDVFWGLGFVAIAWFVAVSASGRPAPRAWLTLALVTVWGLRLSGAHPVAQLGARRGLPVPRLA